MSPLKPISRNDLIKLLRAAGFAGPYTGGKYQFIRRDSFKLTIPNPHQGQIDVNLLGRLLKQAGVSRDDWNNLVAND